MSDRRSLKVASTLANLCNVKQIEQHNEVRFVSLLNLNALEPFDAGVPLMKCTLQFSVTV